MNREHRTMTTARLRSALLFAPIAIAALVFAACEGAGRQPLETPITPAFDPDAGDAQPPETCGLLRCSRDLKSVLRVCDGKEEVIAQCADGLGCGDGRCVDPCTSAELSKGSIGCSFWTIPPEESYRGSGSCFTATVTNTWDTAVALSAELGSAPLDISKSTYTAQKVGGDVVYTRLEGPLPPGGLALIFLSEGAPRGAPEDFISCPPGVVPALLEDPLRHGTTIERAFHLKTDAPVSAYSIYPYGGAPSHMPAATLLLPVSAWGTNYVAITAGSLAIAGGSSIAVYPATTLQIVADEDDTEVRIRPSADIEDGNGVPGTAQGFPRAWKLSRGQVLQFNQTRELTGSALESSKRVGVFGGTECTFIPSTYAACDVLHQQMPALSLWGSEYALVPFPSRIPSVAGAEIRERVPYRLVGAVDGTRLTWDPVRPQGAPEALGSGESITFLTQDLVVVKSQDAEHPFYAGVYMTGAAFNGTVSTGGGGTTQTETLGDPDYVNVVPSDQFLDRYVFFADYTYPETGLTIVRRKTQAGFRPVELDCAGEIASFRPLGASGQYEFAWVSLTTAGVGRTFSKGTCNYGRHEARSDGPFSVTVWGTGPYASYGFAGGMGSRPLNPARVPVPH
jgi:hypothetical protein